jgi:hypothetical protein
MVTTFVTAGIFLSAVRTTAERSILGKVVLFLIPFWLIFQFVLAASGFYQNTQSLPPRLFVFGLGPALLLIIISFLIARENFVSILPLTVLTAIHVIRIPVELTLSWLSQARVVPEIMTYHGTNFDIISGLTAPVAFYFALKNTAVSRYVLTGWNLLALGLVLNVVITAILCVPSPVQRLAFDQPNIAVLHSPYIWLPTVVVPIVFFCHFASLYQLLKRRPSSGSARNERSRFTNGAQPRA